MLVDTQGVYCMCSAPRARAPIPPSLFRFHELASNCVTCAYSTGMTQQQRFQLHQVFYTLRPVPYHPSLSQRPPSALPNTHTYTGARCDEECEEGRGQMNGNERFYEASHLTVQCLRLSRHVCVCHSSERT